MNVTGPSLPYAASFETEFDAEEAKAWMRAHWPWSVICSTLYVILLYIGQRLMTSRPAYALRGPMAVWSALLAAFSICGSIRILHAIWHIYSTYGMFYLLCDFRFYYFPGAGFWTFAFATSKLVELGDTAFIVLRKQKLSFLHWYHHITVFIYCWYNYSFDSPSGLLFGGMNYVVHSFMYSYYTLRAVRVPISRHASMLLTSLQIAQMFVGIMISSTIFAFKCQGKTCPESADTLCMAFGMYLSYLILFAHFFYEKYLKKQQHRSSAAASKQTNGVASNGVTTNGVSSNGASSNGATSNGVKVSNGAHHSNGVCVNNNGQQKKSN